MPTIRGIPGPYRFFFYSFDCNEPKHVHVRRERMISSSGLNLWDCVRMTAFHLRNSIGFEQSS